MLPNVPETVAAFLGCVSIGAVWSVCAPDMGLQAVADRYGVDARGVTTGAGSDDVIDLARSADVLLNISGRWRHMEVMENIPSRPITLVRLSIGM